MVLYWNEAPVSPCHQLLHRVSYHFTCSHLNINNFTDHTHIPGQKSHWCLHKTFEIDDYTWFILFIKVINESSRRIHTATFARIHNNLIPEEAHLNFNLNISIKYAFFLHKSINSKMTKSYHIGHYKITPDILWKHSTCEMQFRCN